VSVVGSSDERLSVVGSSGEHLSVAGSAARNVLPLSLSLDTIYRRLCIDSLLNGNG
jgi:hypothetical protein